MKGNETMKATKKLLALVLAVVMIMAMAATASAATVTIQNAEAGKNYKFYKMFDYVDGWYKATTEWKDVVDDYFELNADGYILSKTTSLSDAALAAALKENIPTGASAVTVVAPNTADLALGYYLMVSELGGTDSLASLAMVTGDVTIREKNTPTGLPAIKKTYADGTTDGDYSIGDTAAFKVVITAQEGGQSYTVHDIAEDLNVDYSSISIEASNGAAVTYTVKTTGITDSCTFEIELEVAEALEAYETITITYNATVTGNNPTNKASLSTGVGADDPGTSSYNYGFSVQKTNGTDTLEGAEFILSRVKDGVTQYAKFESGVLSGWTTVESEADVLVAGTFNVSGLAAGSYVLTEKTAPIGYKKLGLPINVAIIPNLTDGKPNGTAKIEASGGDGVSVNGTIISVQNNPIDPLPETGGMGTTMFYTLGGLMAAAALVLLTSKKRMFA